MNLRNKVSFLLFSFVAVPLFAQTPQQELERLQQNYIQSFISNDDRTASLVELLSGIQPETEISDQVVVELHQRYPFNVEKITGYMETIREDGSWPDINYNDQKRSGWSVKEHADRVLELAKLYRAEEGDCHWGPKLESVIHLALGYWFREKPVCKNWWYNQIGVPKTLGPAFLLMKEQLNPEEKEAAIEVMENAKFGMTGQNKVWLAGNVLMRGLLQDDFELVKAARDTIVSEITTGMQEGIKSDWSFHQHGPQQQFGNYGLAFLTEMSSYSGLFAGTVFALNKEQQGILNSFLLNGYRWIVWKGYMDVNALDRQLFHSGQIHKAFSLAFATNALMRGSSAEDIRQMNEFLKDNYAPERKGSAFIGHKHFWDSDQTVHRSSTWMASVKMASDRVIGTELVNEDNLKGFYMGDGALYTYCRGDEYLNIFPFWDWRKIPGITAYESEAPVPAFFNYGAHVRNKTAFVGGVTDGETGMTAMVLDRDGLQAHKSWIFTRDYVLCLGAGIRSDSILAVTTSVDQRVKRGDLLRYADGNWLPVQGKYVSSPEEQRFFHDNTGYILLQPSACVVISEKRSGRWCDFMGSYAPKTVEGEIVSLYIDHGREDNADYQYLILPASTAEKTAAFAVQDIRVIRNDTSIQAVAAGNCFYVTAYEPQVVNLQKDLQVDLQTPGIYMFRLHNGNWLIEAADPTHKQHSLSLKMNGKDVKIVFPPCHEPGKSISAQPFISAPFSKGIKVDGKQDDWKNVPAVTGLIAPWDGAEKDKTAFYACHDQKNLYFLYEVSDTTLVYNDEKTEASVGNGDRIEFFMSKDPEMKTYYCAEIDPKGKVMDYEAHNYRKFDFNWNFKDLKLVTSVGKDSYRVEGSISLKTLRKLGLISPEGEIRMGVYRADYFDDAGERVIWSSWIVPDAAEPDFHIPSSLGILKLENFVPLSRLK